MAIRTAVVPVSEIFPLRWEVLRPGLPRESAVFTEDDLDGAFHVAAYDGDGTDVLGCGSFYPEAFPGAGPGDGEGGSDRASGAYRIRGMASAPAARGRGYGAAVLRAGEEAAVGRGARLMWCNGRTGARGFYERHGYATVGEEFVIDGVGPHYVFARELG
jgi:GNAT superfamily N-acetyltransferase